MELAFLGLGLLLGVAGWFWQRTRLQRQLVAILEQYHTRPLKSSLVQRVQTALAQQAIAQQQCQRHIERYYTILEAAPVAYLEVDATDCLVCCNAQAQTLLGLSGSPHGRLLLELVRSYELDCLIEEVRTQGAITEQEWQYGFLTPTGQTKRKPLRGRGVPLADNHVGIFLEDREEVTRLRDERDRWATDVAHELKTPLTSLRLVAETLQQRVPEPLQDWVDRLLEEIIRLSLLVQELLELNRLSHTAESEMERQSFDLAQLIQRAWQSLAPLAEGKQIEHAYTGAASFAYYGNEAQLFRLLVNLYDNSIKYCGNGGRVMTRLLTESGESGYLCLEIVDTGSGFPSKDLPHVFERFYRAQSRRHRLVMPTPRDAVTTVPVGSGSGLGLAIARQIVECHGGYIQAANHPEYGGAWLRIYLPRSTH
ncbi:ATP-binding protein [Thermosynechococcaceae cyanobacterium Okahandja]